MKVLRFYSTTKTKEIETKLDLAHNAQAKLP